MIKSIKTDDGQFEQNFIVNYGPDRQVSYVGSADFRFGYTYSYLSTQISRIKHNAGDLHYTLVLNYSNNNVLSNAEFKVTNTSGVIKSFPLTCTTIGGFTTIATNVNDLTFLELQVSEGKLIKALTNSWYLKTSISFQYNDQKGRVYGSVIPIFVLKNPIFPAKAILVNELISLSLQAFSSKQLTEFQSLRSSAIISYTQNSGDLTSIKCQSDELDPDGNLVKSVKTDITYTY
ncbi:hypothetical protein [Pedobacter sp. B4-66]|uniref:hypothetical protein n=1 Tax=Pedobacter sp. B4-66 TaxID=2817280 RepID=UPI001BDAE7BE|nr:hypothetical protein [Pedobacter sp. B4-66]